MVIRYSAAPELDSAVKEIVLHLGLTHIDVSRIICIRSKGSKATRTLARIHGLPRVWQFAFESKPYYVIEVISECFDVLNQQQKEKVLIHELLHVPGNFGGGFRHHGNWVNRQRVEHVYEILQKRRQSKLQSV